MNALVKPIILSLLLAGLAGCTVSNGVHVVLDDDVVGAVGVRTAIGVHAFSDVIAPAPDEPATEAQDFRIVEAHCSPGCRATIVGGEIQVVAEQAGTVTLTARVNTDNFSSGNGESTVTTNVMMRAPTGLLVMVGTTDPDAAVRGRTIDVSTGGLGSRVCGSLVSDDLVLASAPKTLAAVATGCFEALASETEENCAVLRRTCVGAARVTFTLGTISVTFDGKTAAP